MRDLQSLNPKASAELLTKAVQRNDLKKAPATGVIFVVRYVKIDVQDVEKLVGHMMGDSGNSTCLMGIDQMLMNAKTFNELLETEGVCAALENMFPSSYFCGKSASAQFMRIATPGQYIGRLLTNQKPDGACLPTVFYTI